MLQEALAAFAQREKAASVPRGRADDGELRTSVRKEG
jgi:hypothetical protein